MLGEVPIYQFADIDKTVNFKEFIYFLREYILSLDESSVKIPPRTVISLPNDAVWLVMPVTDLKNDVFVTKIVNEYKHNPERGLPKSAGLTLVSRASNGQLLCLLDSNYVTGLRTAALAALSLELRPDKVWRKVGMIGSGLEASFLARAVLSLTSPEEVRVFSRNPENVRNFVERMGKYGYTVSAAPSPDNAVKDADLVVLATDSKQPVISANWLRSDAHVISIDTLPDRRELDPETLRRASMIVVDDLDEVMSAAGDVIHAVESGLIGKERIVPLKEVLRERKRVTGSLTVYKSVGFALLDCAASLYIHQRLSS
ncbi:ornithine cyclodeaminase [Sulfodiicoccus acidiphilus]|uniref:Ornithine cyclodeaminase n=1 Tax=Sulfodiicoccus acidiphilus TaxID=1670455 RepID=A0A348B1K4_9CREN|nr:ornithine cyclodeaminase family protein [Sulfodiicoccus acidiphilus]BBD72056.1 ornithine cyclodeaminase [Sulfodiicoccus acidiphilus]GGU00094.1 ornithine cyclodeaminase [Sulfodiicoccus acidiphilus]